VSDVRRQMSGDGLRLWLPILFGGSEYLTLLVRGNQLLNDSDVYWHLAVGRWIIVNRALPHVDIFSYTVLGKHWITSEWLSEVLYLGVFSLAGWDGVVILAAGSIGAAIFLLMHLLLKLLPAIPAAILTGGAMTLTAPHLLARPHVLVFPVMVCWANAIIRAAEAGRAPSLANLLLVVLWANLHGSFTLGLALIVPFALEAFWTAHKVDRKEIAIQWIRFGALAVAAACITPYGPESILVTFRILGLGSVLSTISEWQPLNFGGLNVAEVCLLLGIAYAWYSGFSLSPVRLVVLLVIVVEALAHRRYVDVVGLVGPVVVANPLARHLSHDAQPGDRPLTSFLRGQYGAAAALLVGGTYTIATMSNIVPPETPVAAVEEIKDKPAGPILNEYGFGGYLIYLGIPTFIDSRAELYGAAFITRYQRAVSLSDVGDFIRLLDEYRIATTLLAPSSPAVGLLDRLAGWERLYADDVAVVHVHGSRTTPTVSPEIRPADAPSNGRP